ncbi:hypothetical protein ACQP1W_02330 [Spirillospora sp. CA-255316]
MINLEQVPGPVLRRLFDVFRLKMQYDRATRRVDCEITITPEIVDTLREAAIAAMVADAPASRAGL